MDSLSVLKTIYQPAPCEIISVSELSSTEKLFTITMLEGKKLSHRPGQFVQVSLLGFAEAPISIANSPTRSETFELAVRKAGTLTGIMHTLHPGDSIGVRGPFGSWFDLNALAGKDLVLIAGGCGLAPMRSLIQYCEDRPDEFGRVVVLYGAKSPDDLLFKDDLETWRSSKNITCKVTVDSVPESSCYEGHVGLITKLIPLLDLDPKRTIAVIVGPPVMYRFVIEELKQKGLHENQICVSLERYMRCGMGKCGHCTIEHLYCCIDGPVFWLNDIIGLRGAL
jgi:sulfhydrogenase subunit gamma (sulfur reductase)